MRSVLACALLAVSVTLVGCDDDDDNGVTLAPLEFTAALTGAAERPDPVTTTATGSASVVATTGSSDVYDPGSNNFTTLTYSVTVTGLSGPATAAHLHGPATADEVANPIATLTLTSAGTSGASASGSLTSTSDPNVSGDSLVTLLATGKIYVNVHTTANPNGEIRGQVVPATFFVARARARTTVAATHAPRGGTP